MLTTEPMTVNCGSHGERICAVICKHLLQTEPMPVGFIENNSDPNDLQAWCYLCEEQFQHEGGMSEAFRKFNDMAVVCVVCYSHARSSHAVQEN